MPDEKTCLVLLVLYICVLMVMGGAVKSKLISDSCAKQGYATVGDWAVICIKVEGEDETE